MYWLTYKDHVSCHWNMYPQTSLLAYPLSSSHPNHMAFRLWALLHTQLCVHPNLWSLFYLWWSDYYWELISYLKIKDLDLSALTTPRANIRADIYCTANSPPLIQYIFPYTSSKFHPFLFTSRQIWIGKGSFLARKLIFDH